MSGKTDLNFIIFFFIKLFIQYLTCPNFSFHSITFLKTKEGGWKEVGGDAILTLYSDLINEN